MTELINKKLLASPSKRYIRTLSYYPNLQPRHCSSQNPSLSQRPTSIATMQLKLFLNFFLATFATAAVIAPIPDACDSGDSNLVKRVPVPLDARVCFFFH